MFFAWCHVHDFRFCCFMQVPPVSAPGRCASGARVTSTCVPTVAPTEVARICASVVMHDRLMACVFRLSWKLRSSPRPKCNLALGPALAWCVSPGFLLHLDFAWVACAQVFDLSDEEAVSEAFASELRDFLQVVAHTWRKRGVCFLLCAGALGDGLPVGFTAAC